MLDENYGKISLNNKVYDFTNKSIAFHYRLGWLSDCFSFAMNENYKHQDDIRAVFGRLIEDLDLLELDYDIINDEEYKNHLVNSMIMVNGLLKTQKHTLDLLYEGYNRLRNEVNNSLSETKKEEVK